MPSSLRDKLVVLNMIGDGVVNPPGAEGGTDPPTFTLTRGGFGGECSSIVLSVMITLTMVLVLGGLPHANTNSEEVISFTLKVSLDSFTSSRMRMEKMCFVSLVEPVGKVMVPLMWT